jgi:hypothetical protein
MARFAVILLQQRVNIETGIAEGQNLEKLKWAEHEHPPSPQGTVRQASTSTNGF